MWVTVKSEAFEIIVPDVCLIMYEFLVLAIKACRVERWNPIDLITGST